MAGARGTVVSISELFNRLEELQGNLSTTGQQQLVDQIGQVWQEAEHVAECLDHRLRQYSQSQFDVDGLSLALWQSVKNLVHLKKENKDLKRYVNEMKLVEAGVDPRPIEIPSTSSQPSAKGTMSHSSSYEDFKRQKLHQKSGPSSSGGVSPQPSFAIRKARSDPDVGMKNMQEDIEALKVDNHRLRSSEKKLLKDTLKLNRRCKLLTEERDRAEDRLKIEQTQRDSIEKLRLRNKELEDQVQNLRQRKIIKEKEKDPGATTTDE